MRRLQTLRLATGTLLAAALLAAVTLAVSPEARARAQQLWETLTIGGVTLRTEPDLPQLMQTNAVAEGQPETRDALAAIQAQTPYAFRTPTWTPEGFGLPEDGAVIVYNGADPAEVMQVVLAFRRGDQQVFFTAVNPAGPERTYLVAPEATVEELQVNGQPAVFTATPLDDNGQPTDQPAYSLKWVQEGVTYSLQGRAGEVTRDDLVRMAESLR